MNHCFALKVLVVPVKGCVRRQIRNKHKLTASILSYLLSGKVSTKVSQRQGKSRLGSVL